jgi:hypothetical protein
MAAQHGAMGGSAWRGGGSPSHHGGSPSYHGAVEGHQVTMAPWRLTKSSWRLTMAPRRLTLVQWKVTMVPWRLTMVQWSHHGSIFHRFLVSRYLYHKKLDRFKRRQDGFAPALEIDQTVSSNSYYVTLHSFILFKTRGLRKNFIRRPSRTSLNTYRLVPISTPVKSRRTVSLKYRFFRCGSSLRYGIYGHYSC